MKTNLLSLLSLIFIFTIMSCDDDDDGIQAPIDIPTPIEDIDIPFASWEGSKLPVIGPLNLNFDAAQYIEDEIPALTIDNVKSAKLTDFTIELQKSSFKGDLSAIKNADIYLEASIPSLPQIKVASVRNNTNKNEIKFNVETNQDLLDYFKSEKQLLYIKDIEGGSGSLTTFTIKLIPKWEMSFGL